MLKTKQEFVFNKATFLFDPKKEYFRVKIGNEETSVKRTDLWMMVFMTNGGKRQDDLLEVKQNEMMQFVRQHQVKATKDIKEGELITVNCNVNVPQVVVDSLLKDKKELLIKTEPNGISG
jgi:hypothetical protein